MTWCQWVPMSLIFLAKLVWMGQSDVFWLDVGEWVSVTGFCWMWVGVGECDIFWLDMDECDIFGKVWVGVICYVWTWTGVWECEFFFWLGVGGCR